MAIKRRAFTLVEMLTVAALIGVVLYLVGQLLVPSALLFKVGWASSEVQQTATAFSHRVHRQLLNTQLETVTIGPNRDSIAFMEEDPSNPFDPSTGAPRVTDHFTVYYYDATARTVVSRRWPPAPPTLTGYDFTLSKPPRLTLADLQAVCTERGSSDRVVARNVESLVFTDEDDDPVAYLNPPLSFSIRCVREASGAGTSRRADYTLTTRVQPRSVRW
ncbi:MAG: prepilin-type N-terminal cleavage/methylation domain-containing protein [Candidatus Eremiobacterota bacterium]